MSPRGCCSDGSSPQRAHRHLDLLVPVRVPLVVVPRAVARLVARWGLLVVAVVGVDRRARAEAPPAQAVEGVERLGLPVVRAAGPDVQQRRAVARPVERAVAVLPVEADDLAAAEPVPGTVVPPRLVGVEPGGERDREHPDGEHQRRAGGGVARGHAREPQPGPDEEEQEQPAQQRLAGLVLGHGGAVEHQQAHEAGAAQHRRAAAGGPERERCREPEQQRRAQQDRVSHPGVLALVGPVDAADAAHAAVDAVGELVPVAGPDVVEAHAGGEEADDEHKRDHPDGKREARVRGERSQLAERVRAGGRHGDEQQGAAAGRVLDQAHPVGAAEGGERRERGDAQRQRVARHRRRLAERQRIGGDRLSLDLRRRRRAGDDAHAAVLRGAAMRRSRSSACPVQPATWKAAR